MLRTRHDRECQKEVTKLIVMICLSQTQVSDTIYFIRRKTIWISPDGRIKNEIDYILIRSRFKSSAIKSMLIAINEILSGNHKTTCFPNSLSINGNEITNQLHIATEFNVFFTNIGLNLSNHIAYSGEKDCEYYLKDNINCKFALNKVDEQYVSKIIDNLPNKASCGFDNISTLFLKQISPTIITPMTLLINQVFNTGIFPERLKLAKVIPVFKKVTQS